MVLSFDELVVATMSSKRFYAAANDLLLPIFRFYFSAWIFCHHQEEEESTRVRTKRQDETTKKERWGVNQASKQGQAGRSGSLTSTLL